MGSTCAHGTITHTKTSSRLMNCSEKERNQSFLSTLTSSVKEANWLWRLFSCSLSCFWIQGLDFGVDFPIQGLQEVPVHLHQVSTSTSANQPTGVPAPLTSPEENKPISIPLCSVVSGHGSRLHSLSQTMPGGASPASAECQPTGSRGW